MSDDAKVPLKIVAPTDLTGDCVRLNKRFDLVEGRTSTLEGEVSTIQGDITTINSTLATQQKVVPAPATPLPMSAPATSSVVVSASFQPITGMSIRLTKSGWWKIDVTARLNFSGDVGQGLYVSVFAG